MLIRRDEPIFDKFSLQVETCGSPLNLVTLSSSPLWPLLLGPISIQYRDINSLQSSAFFLDCPSHLLPNNAHAAHPLRRMVVISFAVIDGLPKVGRLDTMELFGSSWRKLYGRDCLLLATILYSAECILIQRVKLERMRLSLGTICSPSQILLTATVKATQSSFMMYALLRLLLKREFELEPLHLMAHGRQHR